MNLIKQSFVVLLGIFYRSVAFSQTQSEVNTKAYEHYKLVDKKLNLVYSRILNDYSKQKTFIKNFKNAERLWVQLRDAEVKARYPESGTYGSVQTMCVARFLEELTNERIKYLNLWVEGIEEGDFCSGSVKLKKDHEK